MITIHKPSVIYERGNRENNEDYIFPLKDTATNNDKLFIVCDGVGGNNYGEIASQIVTEAVSDYFHTNHAEKKDTRFIQNAVLFAQKKFDEKINTSSMYKNMATTLALLLIAEKSVFFAWLGDSRLYHVRNKKVVWKSKDHSLVNYLISIGEINKKEAENHPKKNQLLKAFQKSDSPIKADIIELKNIKKNDYFLLCSDGIFDITDEDSIIKKCSRSNTSTNIINLIKERAKENQNDNFSLFVIKVKNINSTSLLQTIKVLFHKNCNK